MEAEIRALKVFLFQRMYRHPRVMGTMGRAKQVVSELYAALSGDPSLLPPDWSHACGSAGDALTGGVVRDYIAGMTDRFALSEYARIFHREIDLSTP
jgi:dGTPase